MGLKQALLDEALERFPHRAPADAELAGDLALPQGLARREPAADDPRPQLCGDPLRCRVPPQRLKHVTHAHLLTILMRHVCRCGRRVSGRRARALLTRTAASCLTVDILTAAEIACQVGSQCGRAGSG